MLILSRLLWQISLYFLVYLIYEFIIGVNFHCYDFFRSLVMGLPRKKSYHYLLEKK